MAKKTSSTPKAVPKNNPSRFSEGKVKGSVPRMRNPPQPPSKKSD